MVALQKEGSKFPSSSVSWKAVCRIGVLASANLWQSLPVRSSGSGVHGALSLTLPCLRFMRSPEWVCVSLLSSFVSSARAQTTGRRGLSVFLTCFYVFNLISAPLLIPPIVSDLLDLKLRLLF